MIEGDTNQRMRAASGEVRDSSRLVQFLYILLRDHLTAGAPEDIMDEHVRDGEVSFTNGWTARHAQDLAMRLAPMAPEHHR